MLAIEELFYDEEKGEWSAARVDVSAVRTMILSGKQKRFDKSLNFCCKHQTVLVLDRTLHTINACGQLGWPNRNLFHSDPLSMPP